MELPQGVRVFPLNMHQDERGWFTEIYRTEWIDGKATCQWNAAYSWRNVLRGMHVHHRHWDHMVVINGRMSAGFYDARRVSPTYRKSILIELRGDRLMAVRIPPGVLHGFYFHEDTNYVYGVDAYYDTSDELECHWADPALRIDWPCGDPVISERDRQAGSLAEVEARLCSLNPSLDDPQE